MNYENNASTGGLADAARLPVLTLPHCPWSPQANENSTCLLSLCLCFPSVFSVYVPFSTALAVPQTTAAP